MKTSRIVVACAAASALSILGYAVLTRGQCAPMKAADKTKLIDYVRKRYRVAANIPLDVTEDSFVNSTCYRKLQFKSHDAPRPFQMVLYATPDLRFLSRELMDSRAEAVVGPRQKGRTVAGVADGIWPSLGPAKAPVTMVVFSDFQCPFCQRFAETLRKEILPAEKDQVRVVFRYFPLSMHAWARPAAEAAACAFQQRNEFFWSFHDFFFEHQSEITPGNLQQKVMEHAHGVQGLDAAKFQDCLSQPETKTGVDSAVAFAEQHGIEGTPTIFLNGRETPIVAPEQLRTLISQISKNPQAFAEMAAANPAPARRPELKTIPGLADGNPPALGPAKAPVTIAVFSDFQCPYCARFANMVRSDILPTEGQNVRIVFRYFPLPMHSWARPAAEAAACAFQQKNEFFWSFHDFFFDNQKNLTPGNLRQQVLEHARGVKGLDVAKLQTCMAQAGAKATVDREVEFANQNGIHATPTVFVNGKQTSVSSPEQLRTLISQLRQNPQAVASAATR
jgi:protein-disulfide isomerase